MEVVIITGLSGAGKTKATDWFEDKGYYCIDNMPPALIKNFLDLTIQGNENVKKVAFVMDIRGGIFFGDLKESMKTLEQDETINLKVVFIEATNETLVRRYNETRRQHPLAVAATTKEVIEKERKVLEPLRAYANYVIDTSNLKVAQLYSELDQIFLEGQGSETFVLNLMSFGYKHGIPMEADWVLDMRFIPNPFYVSTLKKLTGNNKKVSRYVFKQDVAKDFLEMEKNMLDKLIPSYIQEGKYSLTVAFGCTGGQHRSVAMANAFYELFSKEGRRVTLEHRDL